ncbi:MAG: hypothetical protein ACLFQY_22370, partial [Desulfococcaceae bacterium]
FKLAMHFFMRLKRLRNSLILYFAARHLAFHLLDSNLTGLPFPDYLEPTGPIPNFNEYRSPVI